MKRPLLFLIGMLLARTLFAAEDLDNMLTVAVARKTLSEAMISIARDIGELKGAFPQLKKWRRAELSPSRIEYQYHYTPALYPFAEESFKKNGCHLLIYTKEEPQLAYAAAALPELKVGIYLKLKASGERAEELKQTIQDIIAKHFEAIRALRFIH